MKPYSETEYRQDYLYVKTKGSLTFQESKTILVNTLNTVYEHGFHGVLFDAREMTGKLSTMQRYDLAKTIAAIASDIVLKKNILVHIAFVGSPPFKDPKKFGITVAKNRGVSVADFDSYDEAKNWLEMKVKAGAEDTTE